MIVYKDYVVYTVLGKEINLMQCETDYGPSTVAEIDEKYHHMGNEPTNIATAIFAWQELNGRDLTSEELRQVLIDNNLFASNIIQGELHYGN